MAGWQYWQHAPQKTNRTTKNMSKIRVLPEQLANRIAAGEVVERPASVVKELIENSLDASATRIDIEIEGGGTRLIRIIDNGEGMDEDDVLLCLERHGTSKISCDEDLCAITSLGFRGEAMPSIASVSKMTITSRQQDAELGSTAIVNYGKLRAVHESGCPRGTSIEVRNLFGNTPARRKFLRTKRTELLHIDEMVKSYGMAAPEVAFSLRVDGKVTLLFEAGQDLGQRLGNLLHYPGNFIEIDHHEPGQALPRLTGLLLPPDLSLKGSARVKIIVNGRSVKDRVLAHAVTEGLRGFLMKGHNPAGLLHLQIDPAEVDVNVHPSKQEVRFRQSRDIHQLMVQAIQQALQGYQQTLKNSFFAMPSPAKPAPPSPQPAAPVPGDLLPITTPCTAELLPHWSPPRKAPPTARQPPAAQTPPSLSAPPGHGLKIIGQYDNLYIFCQGTDGLVVIDQHAAHERLLFERLKQQFLKGHISSQTLLFPETLELSAAEAQKVELYGSDIDKMGFNIREFGGDSYVLSAVPALGGHLAPAKLFLDILELFGASSGEGQQDSPLEDILASMACKAALKAGDALPVQEIEALLKAMAKADLFSHCPHGRPVMKHLSVGEIQKWFHRS